SRPREASRGEHGARESHGRCAPHHQPLVAFLFDVPTGAFADALGRRRSFMVGCLLRCFAFGLYFLSHTYVLFLIAEAIDAIGTTFCNGAVDAWGVDALDESGFEGTKHGLF